MSNDKTDSKKLGGYLLWAIGLTAVALFLTFALVTIMTAFAVSTNVPVLAMISFIVVALGAILYAWYRYAQKAQ
jgi:amino acid transporter